MGTPVVRWITKDGKHIPIRGRSLSRKQRQSILRAVLPSKAPQPDAVTSIERSKPRILAREFLIGAGKTILTNAIVASLTATAPGLGVAYGVYNYWNIGVDA